MVARGFEGMRQIFEHTGAVMQNRRRFAVHQSIRANHIAAEHIAYALVSEADAEDGDSGAVGEDDFAGDAGFLGGARPWRNHDAARSQFFDVGNADFIVPKNPELCTQFAEVLDEIVGERVVVIDDEEHGSADVDGVGGVGASDGSEGAHRFVDAFLMFAVGGGVRDDACAGLDVGFFVFEQDSSEGDAGVGVSVETEVTDGAGVDAALVLFFLVQDLHGADFWGTADRSGGEGGTHDIEAGQPRFQATGDVGDDVHHMAVALDGSEVGDFH